MIYSLKYPHLRGVAPTPTATPPDNTPAPTGTPDAPASAPAVPKALLLFNGVDVAREVQVVPTVGAKAAAAIIKARPAGGYPDLAAVKAAVPHIFEPPFTADLEVIAAWGSN